MKQPLTLLSPAKLNLFLHITGRRPDGYHELQTLFQLLDWGDLMTFSADDSGEIRVASPGLDIPLEDNLVYRAARLLHRGSLGIAISVDKRVPSGAGLGGGSSMPPPPCWLLTTCGSWAAARPSCRPWARPWAPTCRFSWRGTAPGPKA